jgi:hypothetical protein
MEVAAAGAAGARVVGAGGLAVCDHVRVAKHAAERKNALHFIKVPIKYLHLNMRTAAGKPP